ncbi:cAMP-regulated phosphoprotein/endosulfine domain protein [Metarhizium robertsii]|uniref:mRNA stability protein n=1 Tax=Metarhizium robertsii TaxID=568076 RepID=A0A014QRH2_9HYPO|nr:cAMP-regulated phosphoprotein/endosulfine domain protein [Metarhizium robertsii]
MDDSPKDQGDPRAQEQQRIERRYGVLPGKAHRLHQQLQGRTYFDSGDFALSTAHKASNIGMVQTGMEHPLRSNISHPSSAAPASSNVNSNSDKQNRGTEPSTVVSTPSHLHQQMMSKKAAGEEGKK